MTFACSPKPFFAAVVLLLPLQQFARAQPPTEKDKTIQRNITEWIDRLQEIKNGDTGYLPTKSGSGFLPLGKSDTSTMLLFQAAPVKSNAMLELVKHGPEALPQLLAHLDDKRTTQMTVTHGGGFGGMFFEDEYDFNFRTTKTPADHEKNGHFGGDKQSDYPKSHTITVGDLCFVALGQIVNRNFSATRYQPTAIIMVNSPTRSKDLRKTILNEWDGLTPARHRESLIRDLTNPDNTGRRTGACLRLAYYYPGSLESPALKQLAEPLYDPREIWKLGHEKLLEAKNPTERKEIFDSLVNKRGEVARKALLNDLFEDLISAENAEEFSHETPTRSSRIRAILAEFYRYPPNVKSADRPFLFPLSDYDQAQFIEALMYAPTPKLDKAVRAVLHSTEYFSLVQACLDYLTGRGADEDIKAYTDKRLPRAEPDHRQELQQIRERLGWSPLHLAARSDETIRAEQLLAKGTGVNVKAANGQTPLHVASLHGSDGVLQILLSKKADLSLQDYEGRTPLELSIGHGTVTKLLLEHGAIPNEILSAVNLGRVDLVRAFLAKDKSQANKKSAEGATALHIAVEKGQKDIVKLLLEGGADANALNAGGFNWQAGAAPLHIAVSKGHIECAALLLEQGANVNIRQKHGYTPLHLAANAGQPESVKLLLAHKADPDAKDEYGRTPLKLAREPETIRLLGEKP